MPYGLETEFWQRLLQFITRNAKIREVILIGSRAKGNYRPGSDIDFVLKGDDLGFWDLPQLEDTLEEEFFPYKFHLIDGNKVTNAGLAAHIKDKGITVYRAQAA